MKHFKKLLTDLLQELESQVHSETGTVHLDQQSVGRVSRVDALARQQIAKAAEANTRLRITEIKRALKKVDDGSFGECEECGEMVSEARLEAKPEARLCIDCKHRGS